MGEYPGFTIQQNDDQVTKIEVDEKIITPQSPQTQTSPLHLPNPTTETDQTVGVEPISNGAAPPSHSDAVPSVSISMATTPTGQGPQTLNRVVHNSAAESAAGKNRAKFYCPYISRSVAHIESSTGMNNIPLGQQRDPALDRLRDAHFDSFKTWSGKLKRQLSHLRGKPVDQAPEQKLPYVTFEENETLPVDRYFDALEGPELDSLRPSEEFMLPEDRKWPFLLRYQITSFGICLGVSSQAILWKNLASSPSMNFLHVSPAVNMVLWCISIALLVIVALIYVLKLIFYFEAVRREYYHPIRVNFFFAPFIALLFLAQGIPPSVSKHLPHALWHVLMTPFLCLELKIYGQWMSDGQRRLSKVANPSNHLSIIGNFVGALLGANMGLKEGPIFFFAVGLAHYTVLFVTLYQRLPTNVALPKELHPVFFLFVAAPSVASMAWAKIQGSFDNGARLAYFIALFLYLSLVVRINFFRGFRFSLALWAYTFPMTGAAIATIKYSDEVTNWVTQSLAILLSGVDTLVVTRLLVTTLVHAFVMGNLFPNDVAIAISDRAPKPRKRLFHLRSGSSDTKDIEHYIKFVHPDPENQSKDLEASV